MGAKRCHCYAPWRNKGVVLAYAWEGERGRETCLFCGLRFPVYVVPKEWPPMPPGNTQSEPRKARGQKGG